MDIIEIIKDKMKATGSTSEKVSNLCGLTKYSVDNILQKRSNRYDYIVAIAKSLDIPIFDSVITNQDKELFLKTDSYSLALKIIGNILEKKETFSLSKSNLQNCIYNLYTYISKHPTNNELQRAYAEGLFDNLITK